MKAAPEYCRRVWGDNYVIQLFANADGKRASEESGETRVRANINQRRGNRRAITRRTGSKQTRDNAVLNLSISRVGAMPIIAEKLPRKDS